MLPPGPPTIVDRTATIPLSCPYYHPTPTPTPPPSGRAFPPIAPPQIFHKHYRSHVPARRGGNNHIFPPSRFVARLFVSYFGGATPWRFAPPYFLSSRCPDYRWCLFFLLWLLSFDWQGGLNLHIVVKLLLLTFVKKKGLKIILPSPFPFRYGRFVLVHQNGDCSFPLVFCLIPNYPIL